MSEYVRKDFMDNEGLYFIDSIQPYDKSGMFIVRLLSQKTDFWGARSYYALISHELVHRDLISSYKTEGFLENINGSEDGVYDGSFIRLHKDFPNNMHGSYELFHLKKDEYYVDNAYNLGVRLSRENYSLGVASALENIQSTGNKNPELYCFKTGQGDMSLFISSEDRAYLIDTNIYSKVMSDRLNVLKDILGNRPIEALIITHRHIDHYRGAHYLFESQNFKIKNLVVNDTFIKMQNPNSSGNLLLLALGYFKTNGGNIILPNKKDSFKDGNTTFHFSVFDGSKNENDNSMLLQITHQNRLYYLTGDIGANILEKETIHSVNKNKIILKVSHHGSITGTSQKFLSNFAAISQKHAFISFGAGNQYGHPDQFCCRLLGNNGFHTEKSAQMKNKFKIY